jgi:hypothetical protein
MPKVKLTPYGNTQNIEAPDFCPYSIKGAYIKGCCSEKGIQMDQCPPLVHPSLCAICRTCEFISDLDLDLLLELSLEEKQKFIAYCTYSNTKIASNISRQYSYLTREDRIPIVILISPQTFSDMLNVVVESDLRRKKIISYYSNNESPICYILGCPVYLARKLTKSDIQVVGEVSWK